VVWRCGVVVGVVVGVGVAVYEEGGAGKTFKYATRNEWRCTS
jgi:hypothetical protein